MVARMRVAANEKVAILASNIVDAWHNVKKYIEAGASKHAQTHNSKGSNPHKVVVIDDIIGDPFKDTSGPSLNVLIKHMTVE